MKRSNELNAHKKDWSHESLYRFHLHLHANDNILYSLYAYDELSYVYDYTTFPDLIIISSRNLRDLKSLM